jgi:hypothetical protein
LARCGLGDARSLGKRRNLLNLLVLDLSYNLFTHFDMPFLTFLPQFRNLTLTGNPLTTLGSWESATLKSIEDLQLSHSHFQHLNASTLSFMFPNLQVLNMSASKVRSVDGAGFRELPCLRVLDLQGCLVEEISQEMFQSLKSLKPVYAQTFKLCCSVVVPPQFNPSSCKAPKDDLSSCEDLLGSVAYLVSLSVLAVLVVVGNATSFVYRTVFSKESNKLGFAAFVTHLSVGVRDGRVPGGDWHR